MDLYYDENTGTWEPKKEPFATIELATREDFEYLEAALEFYREWIDREQPTITVTIDEKEKYNPGLEDSNGNN